MGNFLLYFQINYSLIMDWLGLVGLRSASGLVLWFMANFQVKKTSSVFCEDFHGR